MMTIPAECLFALGGPQGGDPATRFSDGDHFCWSWHPNDSTDHLDPEDGEHVLVKPSEATLLAVLCRHLGWEGGYRLVLRVERWDDGPVWVVRALTKWGQMPWRDGQVFAEVLPVHISTALDRPNALAAAFVWYARLERVRAGSDATAVLGADAVADLAAIEQSFDLDEWRVEGGVQ